jgi:hypothetical protein
MREREMQKECICKGIPVFFNSSQGSVDKVPPESRYLNDTWKKTILGPFVPVGAPYAPYPPVHMKTASVVWG